MNYGVVIKLIGYLLMIEALLMLPSLMVALYYNQSDIMAFVISIIITAIVGFALNRFFSKEEGIRAKEGLAIVALGWISISFFGSLPFIISNSVPTFIDGFFETISGFTTTGATIIEDVEVLPRGIMFWRSFTHWIGGMGILVFTIALLPILGVGGFQIFKLESPGPHPDRIAPRVRDTAKILYSIYIVLTLVQIILLLLGRMPFYDAMLHTFGTVGTGGFAIKNANMAAYNSTYIHMVMGIFMILSGVNFGLYYSLFKGKVGEVIKNEELRLYLTIITLAVILIALNINRSIYGNLGISLKNAFFQVSSMASTTAYTTVDFDQWPTFSKLILFILMAIGGCAGSTAGGIKSIRVLVLFKLVKREFSKIFHPRAIIPIKVGDKPIANETIGSINSFFILYIIIFALGTILISLEGLDIESSIATIIGSLGNIGTVFGVVGPLKTYSHFTDISKLLLCLLMLLGRLELFTIIALFSPSIWSKEFLSKNMKL